MRFTQKIVTTLILLVISTYAKPMPTELGGLLVREQDKWCGGKTNEECAEHCQITRGTYAKYKCNPKYVNLNSRYIPKLTRVNFYSSCFCVSFPSYHISLMYMALYQCIFIGSAANSSEPKWA